MRDRIVVDPAVHFGRPCVRGTRIPVHAVLELIEQGLPFDAITTDYYPDITADDIRACVHYAAALMRGEELHVNEAEA
jgi:uncharacterized protein (DUF433 family)